MAAGNAPQIKGNGDGIMPDVLTMDLFEGQLNTKFRMHYGDSQSADLMLIDVNDVGSSERQQQFSLVFLAPLEAPILQASYRVDHDKLGNLDLFLVPIARDAEGVRYEAIFNRVVG
jgi:hypothetical protein